MYMSVKKMYKLKSNVLNFTELHKNLRNKYSIKEMFNIVNKCKWL